MIHQNITSRGAGFVRAWIFSIWIVYLLGNMPAQYANLPREQFSPRGFLGLIPDAMYDVLLTSAGLHTLKWVLMVGLVACAVGVRPWRSIAIPTVILLTVHQGVQRGYFYVNHKEIAALFAVYVLAAFPATGFSPFAPADNSEHARRTESDDATRRLMMLALMGALLIPYWLIGVRRLAHNDFSFWSSDVLPYYIARNAYGTTWYGLAPLAKGVLESPFLLRALELGFPIVTVAEVLSPLCIINTRFRRVWIVIMAGFHLSTLVLMDIFFWESLLLFPVLLIDGEFLLRRLDRWRKTDPTVQSEAAPAPAI